MLNRIGQIARDRFLGLKLFLMMLVLGIAPFLGADQPRSKPHAKPVSWHVKNAELRVPVKVNVKAAWLRMPPQVYVADLKPLETTDGLAFDPLSKNAMRTDVRDPKEKAATIAKLKQAGLKPDAFLSVEGWENYGKYLFPVVFLRPMPCWAGG